MILGAFIGLDKLSPFIIGAFCGNAKPNSIDEYLLDFIEEYITIKTDGIFIRQKKYDIRIRLFCCDAPTTQRKIGDIFRDGA